MGKKTQRKKIKRMSREIIPEVEKIFNLGIKILKDEGIAPAMAFYYRDHVKYYVDPLDFSHEAKTKTMNTLRLIASKTKADMAIILCNIFVSSDLSGLPPSQAPDGREAIFVYGKDRNDNYGIAQEYERDSMNKIKLGKKIIFKKDQMEGPITDIL